MHTAPPRAPEDPGIDRKVAFLARPTAYPGGVDEVRAIETHMSWVFLADGFAYKLKKPVRFPYLDFGTLAARRRDSEEEVRLNRRLAPEVYLGLVALTAEADGALALDGAGAAVDWLVKMRRLPEEAMLDRLIAARAVPADRLHALLARLAAFYRAALAVDWGPGIYGQRLARDIEVDAAELLLPRYGLPATTILAIIKAQRAFLARAVDRFEARVRSGRVVEGHGDLRPEHVCLAPEPVVIDCLEFNREFRLVDPVDELCFLALECERLGDAALGGRILEGYAQASGDTLDPGLVAFHKARRACLRGTIAVWHLRDPAPTDVAKWLRRGREYVDLAAKHAAVLR